MIDILELKEIMLYTTLKTATENVFALSTGN